MLKRNAPKKRIIAEHTGMVINTFKVWDGRKYPACMSGTGSLVYLEVSAEMTAAKSSGTKLERRELEFVQEIVKKKHLAKTREAESDLGNAESYKDDFIDVVLQRKVNFKKNPVTAAVFRGEEPKTKPCLNIMYLENPNSCPAGDRIDKNAFAIRYFGSSSEEYGVCGHGNLAIGLSAKIDDALDDDNGIVFFGAQGLVPFELKMVPGTEETDPGHPEAKFEMNMGEEKMFRSFECCNPNDLKDDQTAEGCAACPMDSHQFAQAQQILARRFGMKAADADQITRIFLAPGGQGSSSGWCPESAVTVELASEEALKNIDKRPSDQAWKADLAITSEKVAKRLPAPFPQQVKIIGERVVPANTPDPKGEKDIWKVYGTEDEPLQYRGYLALGECAACNRSSNRGT
jgi:hypothetical protein